MHFGYQNYYSHLDVNKHGEILPPLSLSCLPISSLLTNHCTNRILHHQDHLQQPPTILNSLQVFHHRYHQVTTMFIACKSSIISCAASIYLQMDQNLKMRYFLLCLVLIDLRMDSCCYCY